MPRSRWVNYDELKKAVPIERVLEHYGLREQFTKRGDELVGACPIHKGHSRRQFKVNPEKGAFRCFGSCQAGGNILDLVARIEDIGIRDAALRLVEWFDLEGTAATARPEQRARTG